MAQVEAAVSSGEISTDLGQALENSLTRLDHLAVTDSHLNIAAMDSHILAELNADISSSGTFSGSGPTFGNSSSDSGIGGLGSGVSLGGSPAAVPEPSTIVLALLAGCGTALAFRRRNACRV